jgi:hypothetical protein
MAKNKSVESSAPKKTKATLPLNGFMGFGLFLVCVSIAYANYMVFFGTEFSIVNTLLLTPSTLFVATLALYKFIK